MVRGAAVGTHGTPKRKPAAAAIRRPAAATPNIPVKTKFRKFSQKKRNKRSSQERSKKSLAMARKARAAWKRERAALERTGVFYTPTEQKGADTVRRGRVAKAERWTFDEILAMGDAAAYWMLVKLGFLQDLHNTECAGCQWPLGKTYFRGERRPGVQCYRRGCREFNRATSGTWADHEIPMKKLAALAWLASGQLTCQMHEDDAAQLTGVAHRTCKEVFDALRDVIAIGSKMEQRDVAFSGQRE
ncbi:unnamed protein product, partial [Prorocentrum cordatum]